MRRGPELRPERPRPRLGPAEFPGLWSAERVGERLSLAELRPLWPSGERMPSSSATRASICKSSDTSNCYRMHRSFIIGAACSR